MSAYTDYDPVTQCIAQFPVELMPENGEDIALRVALPGEHWAYVYCPPNDDPAIYVHTLYMATVVTVRTYLNSRLN